MLSTLRYILLAATMTIPVAGWSAMTAREAFINAPSTVLPTLDNITRLDMLDYYEADKVSASLNSLGGKSSILAVSDNSLSVSLGDAAKTTFTLLPSGRDTLVAVISDLKIPADVSFITVYDEQWRPIKRPYKDPALKDWTLPGAKRVMDDIENIVPFVPATMELDPTTLTLTVTNTLSDLLNQEDYNTVKPYFKPSLTYKWKGKKFQLVK